jgi:hypothetical protein
MASNLPLGLQHVLDVYRLVNLSHCSRINAVNEIARTLRIDPQTVKSACTTRLGIRTRDLDEFLHSDKSDAFCDHLVRRFPVYRKDIEAFFNKFDDKKEQTLGEPVGPVNALLLNDKKDLLRLLLFQDICKSISAWTKRYDIPEDVRQEILEIKKQIDKI